MPTLQPLGPPGFRATVVAVTSPLVSALPWHLSLCCLPGCRGPLSQIQVKPGHTLRGTRPPLGHRAQWRHTPASQPPVDSSEMQSTQLLRGSCPNAPQSAPGVLTHQRTLSCLPPSPALFPHPSLSFLFPAITSPQNSLHPNSCLRGTPAKRLTSPVSCRAPQTRSRRTHRHLYPSLNTHY